MAVNRKFSLNGKDINVEFDIGKAIQIETSTGRDVFKELETLGDNAKFSTINELCEVFLGRSMESLYNEGASMPQILLMMAHTAVGTPIPADSGVEDMGGMGFIKSTGDTPPTG